MGKSQQVTERRSNTRYRVMTGAYVINSTNTGMIEDISLTGLAYRYIPRKKDIHDNYQLNIVVGDNDFQSPKLEYEIVSDCEACHNYPDREMKVKRCSVRFKPLSQNQKIQLEKFIENYAMR